MNDIFKNFRWLIISIILGLIISITYNLIKNNNFSSKDTSKINIFDIKINDDVDLYFSKDEIKKYTTNLGNVKKDFGVLNVVDASEKFLKGYRSGQVVFEIKTRDIWSISAIDPINPDECLDKRDERFNEFKVKYKIFDVNNDRLIINNEFKTNPIYVEGVKVASINYHFENSLAIARVGCYDFREGKMPEGSDGDNFPNIGELRFELFRTNLEEIYIPSE